MKVKVLVLLVGFIFLMTFEETGIMVRGPYGTLEECKDARPKETDQDLAVRNIGVSECFRPATSPVSNMLISTPS